MLRILKADFYRLFHSFMFWVFFVIRATSVITSIFERIYVSVRGVGFDGEAVTVQSSSPLMVETSIFSGVLILFVGFTMVYFFGKERKHGFIKNVAGTVERREYMVFSKMVIGAFVTIIYVLFDWICSILSWVIEGNKFCAMTDITVNGSSSVSCGKLISSYGVAVLISFAFVVLFIMLMELIGITAPVYIFGFMLMTGLVDQIIAGIFNFIKSYLGLFTGFEISDYLLLFNLNGFGPETPNLLRFTVVALIYIVVFGGIAVLISRKKDITN